MIFSYLFVQLFKLCCIYDSLFDEFTEITWYTMMKGGCINVHTLYRMGLSTGSKWISFINSDMITGLTVRDIINFTNRTIVRQLMV